MDYYTITNGGVYELKQRDGTSNGSLYLVISSNKHNKDNSNVVVCPINYDTGYYTAKSCGYHIKFTCRIFGKETCMNICTELMFNVRSNRLCRYKFTLSDNVMRKVSGALMQIMFGESMYTREEVALKILQDQVKENEEPEIEEYSIEEDQLSVEESQGLFGRLMDNIHLSIVEPKKQASHLRFKYIYNEYEDFLLDYYTMDKESVLEKWRLNEEDLLGRVAYCKSLSRKNGDDQSFWDQARKERNKWMKESVINVERR